MQGFNIVGPNARQLLQRLTHVDVSKDAFGFMQCREATVGSAPALIARLSLTGELTFEVYAKAIYVRQLYERIHEAGSDLGLVDFGLHALVSMRLEKSLGIWSREFSRDYTAAASRLDRFVAFEKEDFIGKAAAEKERAAPPDRVLVTFTVDADDADATGYEPIWFDDRFVGFVTSGGYGHRVNRSIAMGYVDRALALSSDVFQITILGERRPAHLAHEPLYDPTALLQRA